MYESEIRYYENQIIYSLLAENDFKMDAGLTRKIADEIIKIRSLDDFINGVVVTKSELPDSFLNPNNEKEVAGAYDAVNRVIYLHDAPQKHYINVLRVVLHEIEHANQHQIALTSDDDYDIKHILFKVSNRISHSKLELKPFFLGDVGASYYLANIGGLLYEIHPYERFARIDTFANLIDIIDHNQDGHEMCEEKVQERLNAYYDNGYYTYEQYHFNPTHLFLYFCLSSCIINDEEANILLDRISLISGSLTNDEKHYLGLKYNANKKSNDIVI